MTDSDDALGTIDLSGPETPALSVGRILIGGILLVVFGLLALGCGVLYVAGAFIPGVSELWWDWVVDFVPFVGAIFLGLAIVGLELLRRGRKARASSYEGIANFLEASGIAEVDRGDDNSISAEPHSGPEGTPRPPTLV